MRPYCRELKFVQFCLFLSKFGRHDNSLGSLKILDSIFEFADPKNLTIHTKSVSISCTEMFDVFTIAYIGNFLDFCEK